MTDRRQRLTDEQFDDLKRKRDENLQRTIQSLCDDMGWKNPSVHISGGGSTAECYCACPDGPCQHDWSGPWVEFENGGSTSCSRCGMLAMNHDIRVMP